MCGIKFYDSENKVICKVGLFHESLLKHDVYLDEGERIVGFASINDGSVAIY